MPGGIQHRNRRAAAHVVCAAAVLLCAASSLPHRGDISIAKLADLASGEIIQVEGLTVAYGDPEAAHFRIDIANILLLEEYCRITFTLPTQLTGASGNFPVSFSASSAAWNFVDDPASATSFDPASGTLVPLPDTGSETIYVYVGTSLSPDQTTPSGAYTNTLTLHAELVQ